MGPSIYDVTEDEKYPSQQNTPPENREGTGTPPGGGSTASQGSSDDKEMKDEDTEGNNNEGNPKESREEDPMDGQTGKDNTPKTVKGKETARLLVSFCHLPKSSTNTIVVYFGVSTH